MGPLSLEHVEMDRALQQMVETVEPTGQYMLTKDEQKARIRRWLEDHLTRGLDHVLAVAGDYLARPEQAEPSMRDVYTAFSAIRYTVEDMVSEGDKLVVRWTCRQIHRREYMGVPATGRAVTVSGISIYRMEEGKIAEEWAVVDRLGLLEQLGLTESPPFPTSRQV